ncbi:MAG: hypothetical protein SF052_16090 [Bacteroidia bacterium]|nr:hypothetical protein [Bacteroidia bacterium]
MCKLRGLIIIFLLSSSQCLGQVPSADQFHKDTLYYKQGNVFGYGEIRGDTLNGDWLFFQSQTKRLIMKGNFVNGYPTGEWINFLLAGVTGKGEYQTKEPVTVDWFTEGKESVFYPLDDNLGWGFEGEKRAVGTSSSAKHSFKRYGLENMTRIGNWTYFNEDGSIWYVVFYDENGIFQKKEVFTRK